MRIVAAAALLHGNAPAVASRPRQGAGAVLLHKAERAFLSSAGMTKRRRWVLEHLANGKGNYLRLLAAYDQAFPNSASMAFEKHIRALLNGGFIDGRPLPTCNYHGANYEEFWATDQGKDALQSKD